MRPSKKSTRNGCECESTEDRAVKQWLADEVTENQQVLNDLLTWEDLLGKR